MTDRELMQMALDALEEAANVLSWDGFPKAAEALRARLAQPEPLAQFKFQEYGPPNWGESQVTKPEFVAEQKAMNEALRTMVEPVIQARKEGNLIVVDMPQVPTGGGGVSKEQEPTAYLCENAVGHKYFRWKKPSSEYKPIALYTAHNSPQRIWQGLTDKEIENCFEMSMFGTCRAIEAKLKEKNG